VARGRWLAAASGEPSISPGTLVTIPEDTLPRRPAIDGRFGNSLIGTPFASPLRIGDIPRFFSQ
jgi:hypothetical protein